MSRQRSLHELDQSDRDYVFEALIEKFAKLPMSEFTLEESLLMHKLHVAQAFTFPTKISEKELALLTAALRRILKKADGKRTPSNARGTIDNNRFAL